MRWMDPYLDPFVSVLRGFHSNGKGKFITVVIGSRCFHTCIGDSDYSKPMSIAYKTTPHTALVRKSLQDEKCRNFKK